MRKKEIIRELQKIREEEKRGGLNYELQEDLNKEKNFWIDKLIGVK